MTITALISVTGHMVIASPTTQSIFSLPSASPSAAHGSLPSVLTHTFIPVRTNSGSRENYLNLF
jgi:hypothetical protein